MKYRIAPLTLILLMIVTHLAISVTYANPEVEPTLLQIELTGLKAKIPLREILFSTILVRQTNYSSTNHDSIGSFEVGAIINATTRNALPPDEQNIMFYANLSEHDNTIFQIEGTLDLEKMVYELTSFKIDSTTLMATNSASLKFTSIGILGSIKIEILSKANIQSLTATFLWKNQTLTQNAPNASIPFTFQDLKSNSPEIPFEVNITSNDVENLVFAIGTLRVDSEKVSMPFTVNYWNPNSMVGWKITFSAAQYARESILPIVVSSESSELTNLPDVYTACFRENATGESDQSTGENNQANWLPSILEMLSAPTSLAIIAILAAVTGTVVIYKIQRRIKSH